MAKWRSFLPALVLIVTGAQAAADGDLQTIDLAKLRDPAASVQEAIRILSVGDAKEYPYIVRYLRLYKARPNDPESELGLAVIGYTFDFSDEDWFDDYKIENPDELFGEKRRLAFPADGFDRPTLERLESARIIPIDRDGKEVSLPDEFSYIFLADGYLFDFDCDGVLDLADSSNYRVSEDRSVKVLNVRSIEPSPKVLFRAIHNWDLFPKDEWGFECFDDGNDGLIEIALGSEDERSGAIERKVIFDLDPQTGEYGERSNEPQSRVVALPVDGDLAPHLHRAAEKHQQNFLDEDEGSVETNDDSGAPFAEATESDRGLADSSPAEPPFEYRSMQNASVADIVAFMNGQPGETRRGGEKTENRLPDGFWSMEPKEAAMQLVEANRADWHRDAYRLVLDDRGGITPPMSGWVLHDYHGDNSYSYYAHVIAVRFEAVHPYLLFASERSQGIVGANPLVDQPSYAIRLVDLTPAEAQFLADTIFWLDRVRTRAIMNKKPGGGSSSTADGWASLHLVPDGDPPRQIDAGTIPAFGSLEEQLTENYQPNTCLNFVDYLLGTELPKQIADRWNANPHLGHPHGRTDLKEPHGPDQAREMRASLERLSSEIFRRHAAEAVPAPALRRVVECAGAERFLALRPSLKDLAASLPAENAGDREFERLRVRFRRDHFGNWLHDDGSDEEHEADYARYRTLVDERRLEPGAVLRDTVAYALIQLDAAENLERLMAWARGQERGSNWALQQLARHHPAAYAEILTEQFEAAEERFRETILRTLAEAHPDAALRLINNLDAPETKNLLLPIALVESEFAPDRAKERIPALLDLAESKEPNLEWERGEAMELLGRIDLTDEQFARLEAIALALLENEKQKPLSDLFGIAVEVLLARDDRDRYWDAFRLAGMEAMSFRAFESLIAGLARLAEGRPDRRAVLEEVIRRRLASSDGMMRDAFLAALALDLRGLRPELSELATSGPDVPDGRGAVSAQGSPRSTAGEGYHAARGVLALWEEEDPATSARLWIAFIASHANDLETRRRDAFLGREVRTRAKENLRHLSPAERKQIVNETLAAMGTGAPDAGIISWLE